MKRLKVGIPKYNNELVFGNFPKFWIDDYLADISYFYSQQYSDYKDSLLPYAIFRILDRLYSANCPIPAFPNFADYVISESSNEVLYYEVEQSMSIGRPIDLAQIGLTESYLASSSNIAGLAVESAFSAISPSPPLFGLLSRSDYYIDATLIESLDEVKNASLSSLYKFYDPEFDSDKGIIIGPLQNGATNGIYDFYKDMQNNGYNSVRVGILLDKRNSTVQFKTIYTGLAGTYIEPYLNSAFTAIAFDNDAKTSNMLSNFEASAVSFLGTASLQPFHALGSLYIFNIALNCAMKVMMSMHISRYQSDKLNAYIANIDKLIYFFFNESNEPSNTYTLRSVFNRYDLLAIDNNVRSLAESKYLTSVTNQFAAPM